MKTEELTDEAAMRKFTALAQLIVGMSAGLPSSHLFNACMLVQAHLLARTPGMASGAAISVRSLLDTIEQMLTDAGAGLPDPGLPIFH